jgi:hypothetical protein
MAVMSVVVTYVLPTVVLKYGSEEHAVAKYRFTFDRNDGNGVEDLLHAFAADHELEIRVIHLLPRGPYSIDVSIEGDTFGELTVNNGVQENMYLAYYYQRHASSDSSSVLEDLRSRLSRLGAKVDVVFENRESQLQRPEKRRL